MDSIIKFFDSYQILTNLLPGAFLMLLVKYCTSINLPSTNAVEVVIMCYFIGLIIDRIGSLIIEPILKKAKFISYAEYSDFLKAASKDSKIDILTQVNNSTRSILSCLLFFPIISLLHFICLHITWLYDNWKWIAILFLVLLFLFAFKKQSNMIRKRVESVNKDIHSSN